MTRYFVLLFHFQLVYNKESRCRHKKRDVCTHLEGSRYCLSPAYHQGVFLHMILRAANATICNERAVQESLIIETALLLEATIYTCAKFLTIMYKLLEHLVRIFERTFKK